jgi:glyceraldehyde 3-phosphate dehydrogenase
MKKIAINGFGRIGRLTARIILTKFPDLEIVAVNDLTSPENLAYLFEFDSVYRKFEYPVKSVDDTIIIETPKGTKTIKVLSQRDPAMLPWKEMGIDVVIESTGFFTNKEGASKHLEAGAKKVIISAPAKSEDVETALLGVKGVDQIQGNIVSNASCTTNCIAPAFHILHTQFGVEKAFGITAHAYTATQVLQDGPNKKGFRDGRAAAVNAIPATTGAAKAVFEVMPDLKGKVKLSALRIPTITGSMVYITAELQKEVSVEEINKAFETASQSYLKGILEYTNKQIVSTDVIQNSHSTVFDSLLTETLGKTAKIVIWYDNEWGYSNRLAELAESF